MKKDKNKRKYVVFGQAEIDHKPFLCYNLQANNLPFGEDTAKSNCYSAEYCLMTKKEAKKNVAILATNFPHIAYGMKKFLP